jgi:hypothetical protein
VRHEVACGEWSSSKGGSADVQRELATVRTEQDARASASEPGRPPDVSGLTSGTLARTRRELAASLALARPGSPARRPVLAHLAAHRHRACPADHRPARAVTRLPAYPASAPDTHKMSPTGLAMTCRFIPCLRCLPE